MKNPFECGTAWGHPTITMDSVSRIERVRGFNAQQLRAVLELPGCQKTVIEAARRRLKKLEGGK